MSESATNRNQIGNVFIVLDEQGYVDLGPIGNYTLPFAMSDAYGTETVQHLADYIGAPKEPGLRAAGNGEAAYRELQSGDPGPAGALLIDELGVEAADADDQLAKLSV